MDTTSSHFERSQLSTHTTNNMEAVKQKLTKTIKKLDNLDIEKGDIANKLEEKVDKEKKLKSGKNVGVKQSDLLIDLENNADDEMNLSEEQKKVILDLQEKCKLLLEMMETKEKKFQDALIELRNELLAEIEVLKKNGIEMKKKLEKLENENVEKAAADQDLNKNQVPVAVIKDEDKIKSIRTYDSWLKNGVFELEKWFLLQGEQLNTFIFQKKYWNNPPDFIWKVTNITKTMAKKTWDFTSPDFDLNGYLFKGRCKIEGNYDDQNMSLKLSFRSFINSGRAIPFRLVPAVYYIIKECGRDDGPSDMTMSAWSYFKEEILYGKKYYEVNVRKDILKNPLYNVNDSLSIEIHVEPPSMARHVYSYDGSVTWAVEGFKLSRELESNGLTQCHTGPYFYTSPRGYRIRFRIYLNGKSYDMGKGITAEITFLTGDFDKNLTKSFPHKTSVTIFNTKDPTKYKTISKKENIDKYSSYTLEVITNEDLAKYVFEDTLVYKVAIDEM